MTLQEMRTCFVIMPFNKKMDPTSKAVIDFDFVYEQIIRPAIEKDLRRRGLHVKCIRSDKIAQAGLIHERMIRFIAEADVAVVDITTWNANVFYELGIRHALRDRVTVILRRATTPNPFNITGMETIDYRTKPEKAVALARTVIANHVFNGLMSGAKDSLVYSMMPGLKSSLEPERIGTNEVEEYEIPNAKGRRIGIVTGSLRSVNLSSFLAEHPIAIWVSSENINMQMARSYEASMSGLIRYLGAQKDETGHIVDDTIAKELAKVMGARQIVNPGEVVATGSGCLAETHKVKRIYHAASVYGVVGTGFHPIVSVEHCVTNALARADREHREKDKTSGASILFPLFGTGTARAEMIPSARRQMSAAISYVQSRADFTRIERVYFLAPTKPHLSAMRVALAELGLTKRWSDATAAPTGKSRSAPVKKAPPRRRTSRRRKGAQAKR